jgi:hypothetical protein
MAKLDSVTIADPAAKIASAAAIEMRAFDMPLLLRTSFAIVINAQHLRRVPNAALSKGEAPRQNFKLRHYRLAVRVSGETWWIVTFLTITRDGKGPVPNFRV